MSAIRTGNHWRVTIVDDGQQPPDASRHRPDAQLLAVVMAGKVLTTDAELAERVARLLNTDGQPFEAIELLEYALHLRMHGENAPGGNETWAEFDCRCEDFLRRRHGAGAPAELGVAEDAPRGPSSATLPAQDPSVGGSGRPAAAEAACGCLFCRSLRADLEPDRKADEA